MQTVTHTNLSFACFSICHLLFALALQEKVSAEAALTLIPNAVVLTVHTHGIILSRALRNPVNDLQEIFITITLPLKKRDRIKKWKKPTADLHSQDLVDGLLGNQVPT